MFIESSKLWIFSSSWVISLDIVILFHRLSQDRPVSMLLKLSLISAGCLRHCRDRASECCLSLGYTTSSSLLTPRLLIIWGSLFPKFELNTFRKTSVLMPFGVLLLILLLLWHAVENVYSATFGCKFPNYFVVGFWISVIFHLEFSKLSFKFILFMLLSFSNSNTFLALSCESVCCDVLDKLLKFVFVLSFFHWLFSCSPFSLVTKSDYSHTQLI